MGHWEIQDGLVSLSPRMVKEPFQYNDRDETPLSFPLRSIPGFYVATEAPFCLMEGQQLGLMPGFAHLQPLGGPRTGRLRTQGANASPGVDG